MLLRSVAGLIFCAGSCVVQASFADFHFVDRNTACFADSSNRE